MSKFQPNFKEHRVVSKSLRDFARNQECTLQMPWCNHDTETTVHCHVRKYGLTGLGQKPTDIHGFHACSECHRRESEAGDDDILRAVFITQIRLIQEGIIKVKGDAIKKFKQIREKIK
ncbi:MAG: DUF1364 family protein [Flavobacteriaceae bacterium]|nr:DUF1364 family protein [Flavobacteriaceae bacterium]